MTSRSGGDGPGGDGSILRIEALTGDGGGLARPAGRVWLVPRAFPGDEVLAAAVRVRPRYVEGRLLRVLAASPDRRHAPCPVQDRCGGCPWMGLAEPAQRGWKARRVRDALERIGRLDPSVVENIRSGERALGYRNRVEFTLGRDPTSGRPVVGLHAGATAAGLVDVEACALQGEPAQRVLASAREFLLSEDRQWWRTSPDAGIRLAIRRSAHTGEVLVAICETGVELAEAGALADRLASRHPEVCGVVRLERRDGRRGGARTTLLRGRAWVEERLGTTVFRVPAACFTQVNADWTGSLPALVRECAGELEGAGAVDLYGGVGANGIELARAGAPTVAICEADLDAVSCGREAARRAGLEGVRFTRAGVAAFLSRGWPRTAVGVVVANPPRSGLGRGIAATLAARRAPKLVIVSCDPATLARDLRVIVDGGYRLRRLIPLDLFPQTPHVEAVAELGLE